MEIWQQIAKDSEKGAARLVSEYGNRLFAAAVLLCSNAHDAEDLVFRTFDRVVRKIGQYDDRWNFFSWVYAILLNFRRMDLRRRHVAEVPMGTSADLPEHICLMFGQRLRETRLEELRAAIRGLDEPLKEAIVLHYFENRPLEEMAAVLNVPVGTAKSRLHRAREELAIRLLKKESSI